MTCCPDITLRDITIGLVRQARLLFFYPALPKVLSSHHLLASLNVNTRIDLCHGAPLKVINSQLRTVGCVLRIEETTERKLTIYSKNKTIHIESTLEKEAVVTIYDLSGQLIKRLTIQPMTKKIIPVSSRGIYIVNKQKVAVP